MNALVKSADRVIDILELFATTDQALALRDVVRILGLPKSSTHMLLGTLATRGYLVRMAGETYQLAPAMEQGGWVGGVAGQVYRAAQVWLDRLLERHQETVVLGAPTPGLDVRLLSHRNSPQLIRYDVSQTPVIPGWSTALGCAILSWLPEEDVRAYLDRVERTPLTPRTVTGVDEILANLRAARGAGVALNIDARFEGAAGAAVAIRDPEGRPHAALNCVTVTPRFRRNRDEIIASLREAATAIETELFGAPVPEEITA